MPRHRFFVPQCSGVWLTLSVASLCLAADSFYRERYIQASRQHEQLRRKLQNQAEQDVELVSNQKRQLERKVS